MIEDIDNNNRKDIFSYYREKRPECFSDSITKYEVPLTEELFDLQMQTLSQQKKHSEFESFILALVRRLITPNINSQTGPDGGGDGGIDGETYEVSDDISNKWFMAKESHNNQGDWAIAISCMKNWKDKVKRDVKKIVESKREYTHVLFFTNQMVKVNQRVNTENDLMKEFGIKVTIFDGNWCKCAVFENNCIDIALDKLNFSDEYKHKIEIIGPNDRERKNRLEEVEKSILRRIDGLDTNYVEELREAYILSRSLENHRTEIEGRIYRAIRECLKHGTAQQYFIIIYDFAWTCFFWFRDVEKTYNLYLGMKNIIRNDCNVARLEMFLNIFTNLLNANHVGLFNKNEELQTEADFIESLEQILEEKQRNSSKLYLRLYIEVNKLIYGDHSKEAIDEQVDAIRPLLLESIAHIDISFESEYGFFSMLNEIISDNPNFDKLVDEMAEKIRERKSNIEAGKIHFARAQRYLKDGHWVEVVKHLGFCVQAFDSEEYQHEMVKSSIMMGIALNNLNLPYSALVYFVKSVAILTKNVYINGEVPRVLITTLHELCQLEVRLGRIAMFLVWHELMIVFVQNGNYYDDNEHLKDEMRLDVEWACRFSAMDTATSLLAILPDILERHEMHISTEFLRYVLGYPEKIDVQYKTTLFENNEVLDIREQLHNQEIFEQFLGDTILSSLGPMELKTTVRNCTINVLYENSWNTQIVAEMFLAMIEIFFATSNMYEMLISISNLSVKIVNFKEETSIEPCNEFGNEYTLSLNTGKMDERQLFNAFISLLGHLFSRHVFFSKNLSLILDEKQGKEKIFERVSCVLQYNTFILNMLGTDVKYRIDDWSKESDFHYRLRGSAMSTIKKEYFNSQQKDTIIATINNDMSLWEKAKWKGCVLAIDTLNKQPPIFGLAFLNVAIGEKIVREWSGKDINIFIVRGIEADHPTHYRVTIAPKILGNIGNMSNNIRFLAYVSRKYTMTPDTTVNMDRFERAYNMFKCCLLKSYQMNENRIHVTPNPNENPRLFSNVIFKNAWEIGPYDEAMVSLCPDDNPLIPTNHKDDAPVLELLQNLRKTKKG